MRLGAKAALQKRESNQRLENFNDQWTPGTILRAFYPIFWDDETQSSNILVGAIYGYKVNDMKALGLKTIFIPSLTEIDENGEPIGNPDILYRFSKIAPIFINARKAGEIYACNQQNWPDETMHRQALDDIEQRYDTANNLKAIKPVIGRLEYLITTEVVVVPMVNDMPQLDKIKAVSQPMNQKKINSLYSILMERRFAVTPDDTFLEVEWSYPSDAQKTRSAINATVSGITPEYRLLAKHQDIMPKLKMQFDRVATDSDVIIKRAVKYMDESRIKQALSIYSIQKSLDLKYLNEEATERLCNHSDLIKTLGVYNTLPEGELKSRLTEALNKTESVMAGASPTMPTASAPEAAVSNAPVTPAPGVPGIDALLAGTVDSLVTAASAVTPINPAGSVPVANSGVSVQGTDAQVGRVAVEQQAPAATQHVTPGQLDLTEEELLGVSFN